MKKLLLIASLTAGAVWMYRKRGSTKATSKNIRINRGRLSARKFNLINVKED
ncbi:hypothetical protein [Dolosigranulum pigrum]|uniref:hypothetical protein n=1 Tax=Dolosigranulum pigrum TaxID=29394 RepID=UPI00163D49B8|nr:hypothetical protein [Dolosigranulum pigrum]